MRKLFRPTSTQTVVLAVIATSALGFALAMRYLAIENTPLGLACDAGDPGLLCASRKTVIAFSQASVFGGIAFVAALITVLRPSLVLCAVSLAAAGLGLVLYNTPVSAVAVAVLTFSLARAAPEPE